jgi:NADPH:quinone reductase-like Zn-dependent oxidoreductase
MGTRDELVRLTQLLVQTGVRPLVDTELPLDQVREGFARMDRGELFGKVVFTVGG